MTDYSDLKLLAEASVGIADISSAPDVVLTLIAEIDRVNAELSACKEGPGTCGYWRDAARSHLGEINKLKELINNQKGNDLACPRHQREKCLACAWPPMEKSQLAVLKAENEALQKDAERYRWLKDKNSDPSVVSSSEKYAKYFFEFMLCEDRLDSVIDAAMGKEAQL